MIFFVLQSLKLVLRKVKVLESVRVASYESRTTKQLGVLSQAVSLCKMTSILDVLVSGFALQRSVST